MKLLRNPNATGWERVAPLAIAAAAALVGWPAEAARAVEIVVPAYFYPSPGSDWDDLNTAAAEVPITAIMNPGSGPGGGVDSNYTSAVSSFRTAGGKVIGYVYSGYGGRPLADVLSDIDDYAAWYEIDGIFIDEMSNLAETSVLDFYESIYDHVKSIDPEWELMGNPGTTTQEEYLTRPVADRLMVFENYGLTYPSHQPSEWNADYDSSRFVNLLHELDSGDTAADYVELAVARNVGGVFFTDDVLPNPWDRLPDYWEQFVDKVAEVNNLVVGPLETLSNPVAPGAMQIDGSRADWSGVAAYSPDSDDTPPGPELNLASLALANDDDELFVRILGEAPGTATPSSTLRVYLDTDDDRGTGYLGGGGEFSAGADYLVLNDKLYAFQGATQQTFSWSFLVDLSVDDSIGSDEEIAVPLGAIGDPAALGVFAEANNTTANDYLPNGAVDGALGTYFRYEIGPAPIPGDYDDSGVVDQQDFFYWSARFGGTDPTADGNGDGLVDTADYVVWRDALENAEASLAVPEPSASWAVLSAGWLLAVARQRAAGVEGARR